MLFIAACSVCGAPLPEIVAKCGEWTVSREEAARLVQQAEAGTAARFSGKALLKKVLTDHFCAQALTGMLTEAGFSPSAGSAEKLLLQAYRDYPPGVERPSDGDLHRMAQDPKVQLQWAFRQYLQARRPEVFLIPHTVVERYYRENQQMFLMPARKIVMEYTASAPALLNTLQARVRQGEPPEKAAAGIGNISSAAVTGAYPELQSGQWSRIMPGADGKHKIYYAAGSCPASYIPLAHAAPLIRELMIRRRAAYELEQSLKAVFDTAKMEFYF